MYLLVSDLFMDYTSGDDSVHLLSVRIRLFLSAFDRLDMATHTSRVATPRWVTSYNFMCLLNIPGIVRKFGVYKFLYEGKYCGEGFNHVLKPTANRTSHRNRSINLMRNINREKSMAAVQDNFRQHSGDSEIYTDLPEKNNRSKIYRMANRYKKRGKMISHYNSNIPLSVVIVDPKTEGESSRSYGICYIYRKEIFVAPIVRELATEMIVADSLRYWHWDLKTGCEECYKLEGCDVIDYGILLPLTSDPARPGQILPPNFYTISTYLWNSEHTVLST
jgi:hypothetical protein